MAEGTEKSYGWTKGQIKKGNNRWTNLANDSSMIRNTLRWVNVQTIGEKNIVLKMIGLEHWQTNWPDKLPDLFSSLDLFIILWILRWILCLILCFILCLNFAKLPNLFCSLDLFIILWILRWILCLILCFILCLNFAKLLNLFSSLDLFIILWILRWIPLFDPLFHLLFDPCWNFEYWIQCLWFKWFKSHRNSLWYEWILYENEPIIWIENNGALPMTSSCLALVNIHKVCKTTFVSQT